MFSKLRLHFSFFVVLIGALYACTSDSRTDDGGENNKIVPSVLNYTVYDTPEEMMISQGFLFNKKEIKKLKIKSIERKIYSKVLKTPVPKYDSTNTDLSEVRTYFFDTEGNIQSQNWRIYDQNVLLKKVNFKYLYEPKNRWIQDVEIGEYEVFSPDSLKIPFEEDPSNSNFNFFFQQQFKNFGTVYNSKYSTEMLYVIKDQKDWKNSILYSLLKPRENDWLIWGTIERPVKRYHLLSAVNESNVCTYEYYENSDMPKLIVRQSFPFTVKRDFEYGADGICKAYTDSTFADNEYITHVVNKIFTFEKGLPETISHEKKNVQGGYVSFESFKYTFHPQL